MALVKGISESQGARMFHLMMIIPAGVLLLLLSLISLGTMASANKQVKEKLDDLHRQDGRCILYTKANDDESDFKFNDGGECGFVVWGGAVLAILAVALSIVLGAKALFGTAVFSFLSIIELGLSALGAVWALIMAVVITAGLDVTCRSYRDVTGVDDHVPCCVISAVGSSQKDSFFFYEDINTSKIAAWFGMGLLICLAILYGIILIIFCCRVTNVKRGDMYRELPESAAQ